MLTLTIEGKNLVVRRTQWADLGGSIGESGAIPLVELKKALEKIQLPLEPHEVPADVYQQF